MLDIHGCGQTFNYRINIFFFSDDVFILSNLKLHLPPRLLYDLNVSRLKLKPKNKVKSICNPILERSEFSIFKELRITLMLWDYIS